MNDSRLFRSSIELHLTPIFGGPSSMYVPPPFRFPRYPTRRNLQIQMTTDSVFAELTLIEQRWSAREGVLNAHGYQLRPRLRKGWTPSWFATGENPLHCEDGQLLPVRSPTL